MSAHADASHSTTDTTTPAEPDVVPLREGLLACRSCGFATAETSESETVTGVGWDVEVTFKAMENWSPPSVTVTLCRACREREESADLPPHLAARLGPQIGRERLVAALDGLAALGVRPPATVAPMDLIRHLNAAGQQVRWVTRFVPLGTPGRSTRTAARVPWAHVTDEQRAALRDGYGAVLAATTARHAPNARLTPPSGPPACLMCGIGAVTLTASRVVALGGTERARERVWTHRVVTSPVVLGGGGSKAVTGHTCPECTQAISDTGAIGPDAIESSLAAYLREAGRSDEARLVREAGLARPRCWVTVRESPNPRRWGHIGRVVPPKKVPSG